MTPEMFINKLSFLTTDINKLTMWGWAYSTSFGLYSWDKDLIYINPKEGMNIRTVLHELAHWTGHKSRLNREQYINFSDPERRTFKKEEVTAEFAGYLVAKKLGILTVEHKIRTKEYLRIFYKKEDFKSAIKDSKKAADYILTNIIPQIA